ncbi:MAG: hypothetical protein R3E66_14485 [bacterium]
MKKLILLFLVAGCSVERGASDWEPQQFSDAGPDLMVGVDGGIGEGPGAGTMDGTWLLLHEGSTCVINAEQLTHAWYVVDIQQDDRVLTESRTICRVDLSPVLGLRVIIPPAAIDSIDFVDIDKGFVSDLRVGGSYSSSSELALWGLELANPVEDEVPGDATDPGVVDGDGDGQPGVTFNVENSTCQRFQGQRQIIRYSGKFDAPNSVIGTSVNLTDVKVYGSTEALCGIAPPVISNDNFSRFRMVRIDGAGGAINLDANADGTISCEEASQVFDQVMEFRAADNNNCKR